MRWGIISCPMPKGSLHKAPSYIYQSYLTWSEWAGAGVVLIPFDSANLMDYFSMVDGFIWAGGGIENLRTHSEGQFRKMMETYAKAFDYAVEQNKKRSFPIYGICMGFYLLVMLSEGVEEHMFRNVSKMEKFGMGTLTFKGSSEMKELFTVAERRELARTPVANHMHHLGFDVGGKFVKGWKAMRVVSVDEDFVNMVEHKQYPFYGSQWHPDRPLTELGARVSHRLIKWLTGKGRAHKTWANLNRMGTSILIL